MDTKTNYEKLQAILASDILAVGMIIAISAYVYANMGVPAVTGQESASIAQK